MTVLLCAVLALCVQVPTALGADASSAAASVPGDHANGSYLIDVKMEGGSGKATVESPAALEIEDGKAYVTLVWSSDNYDYMLVNGEKVKPTSVKPTSQFRVPVLKFDEAYEMIGDTTAMGTPHEIAYSFTFDSSTIKPDPSKQQAESGQASESQQGSAQQESQSGSASTDADTEQLLLGISIGSFVVALIAIGITIGVLRSYRKRR